MEEIFEVMDINGKIHQLDWVTRCTVTDNELLLYGKNRKDSSLSFNYDKIIYWGFMPGEKKNG